MCHATECHEWHGASHIAGTCIGAAQHGLGFTCRPRCDAGPGVPRGLLPHFNRVKLKTWHTETVGKENSRNLRPAQPR